MKRLIMALGVVAVLLLGGYAAQKAGLVPHDQVASIVDHARALVAPPDADEGAGTSAPTAKSGPQAEVSDTPAQAGPAVSVARVEPREFVDTLLVTGSLAAREEVLVAPEVEGLRIVEILVEEGDWVETGDVLARLQDALLKAERDANTAALERVAAQKAQAESLVAEAEAVLDAAQKSVDRAKPLKTSGYLSDSLFDQRERELLTAKARKASALDGLKLADAQAAELEAKRREIDWRLSKTEIRAPRTGRVAERNARLGQTASAVNAHLFRIIEDGAIELDAEVEDTRIGELADGQRAQVTTAGGEHLDGHVRLVSAMVDDTTRLGRVRIALGRRDDLRIGSFARARIETGRSRGLAVPSSAVLYSDAGPRVQTVVGDRVATTPIKVGLTADGFTEVVEGLAERDVVVAKAGTFLRDGDRVRAIRPPAQVSDVRENAGVKR